MSTTTIQISRINSNLLDRVAQYMVEKHPEIWGANGPSRNAVVGFLTAEFMNQHGLVAEGEES